MFSAFSRNFYTEKSVMWGKILMILLLYESILWQKKIINNVYNYAKILYLLIHLCLYIFIFLFIFLFYYFLGYIYIISIYQD